MPKYSVIIPTYNDAKRIPRAINSVIKQKLGDWELIIIDDGSTDKTSQIVIPYVNDLRINYFKKPNAGVAAARNTGYELSKGKFIVFLDSDDEVKPDLLKDFDDLVKSKSNVGILSCGLLMGNKKRVPRSNPAISNFKYSNLSGSFCVKAEVFHNCGRYDENLKQSENWEMMARALEYCNNYNFQVVSFEKCNLLYHHQTTETKTKMRDLFRAEASYYLAQKYAKNGVLNYNSSEFLVSAAVNYTRVGELEKAKEIFEECVRKNPNLSNILRLFIFRIPFLRAKKWGRNY